MIVTLCFAAPLIDHASYIGERDLCSIANQERLANFFLELAHHLADSRLGNKHRGRGLCEVAKAHGLDEIAQSTDIKGNVRGGLA